MIIVLIGRSLSPLFFFFNDTATTEIYTLSLHDALPISILPTGSRGRLTAARRLREAHHGNRRVQQFARSRARDAHLDRAPYRQELRLGFVSREPGFSGIGAGADALYRGGRLAPGRRPAHTEAPRLHAPPPPSAR